MTLPSTAVTTLVLLSLAGCSPRPAPLASAPALPSPAAPAPDASGASGGTERSSGTDARTGILVMAHGGDAAWNASVDAALRPLRAEAPLALAFGMADRATLQAGLDTLAAAGVDRVAVVRMFLSGRSFEDQTRYLLRLSETPPAFFIHHASHTPPATDSGHGGHGGSSDAPFDAAAPPAATAGGTMPHEGTPMPVDARGLAITTHVDGLMDWAGVGAILRERAVSAGAERGGGVLLLGHGMGDDDENAAVLRAMDAAAESLRADGWGPVEAETLREDWPEAREAAEHRIRAWVGARGTAGTPLVIPFRLSGFGPYADVLDGREYLAGDGLLPHASIADWVETTARRTACGEGWTPPTGAC